MASDFQEALMWHMDRHETTIAEIVASTGVSRDVINKLRTRPNSSTNVENAMLIAAFYGKTVNQFVMKEEATTSSRMAALFQLLEPEETRLLEAQIRGLLAEHGARPSE